MPDGLPDEELFAGAVGKKAGGLGGLLAGPAVKGIGAGVFATWLLNKILQTERRLEKDRKG